MRRMRRLEPRGGKVVATATAWAPSERVACDRCGYSKSDGNLVSYARFRIHVGDHELHFCAHHWYKYRFHILEHAYETTEL